MAQEPGFAQDTSILGLRDTAIFDGDTNVVAHTTAECAHHVIDLHTILLGTVLFPQAWLFSNSTSIPLVSGIPVEYVSLPMS